MELFNKDGHLTKQGMKALINEQLDELESLEASEHLSFCDTCLLDYLEQMENQPLLTPSQPLTETVLVRIRKRAKRILFNQYTTVAAAACLVIAMWSSGFIGSLVKTPTSSALSTPPPVSEPAKHFPQKINNAIGEAGNSLNNWFNDILHRPEQEPAAKNKDSETSKKTPSKAQQEDTSTKKETK